MADIVMGCILMAANMAQVSSLKEEVAMHERHYDKIAMSFGNKVCVQNKSIDMCIHLCIHMCITCVWACG